MDRDAIRKQWARKQWVRTRRNLNALTESEREVWEERVAICQHMGGLGERDAMDIAWEEIKRGR